MGVGNVMFRPLSLTQTRKTSAHWPQNVTYLAVRAALPPTHTPPSKAQVNNRHIMQ